MGAETPGSWASLDSIAALVAQRDRKRSPRAAMALADMARPEDVPRILPAVLSLVKGGGHTMTPTGVHVLCRLHKLDPDAIEAAQRRLWDEKSRRLQAAAYDLLRRGVGRKDLAWNLGRAHDLLATSDGGQRYLLRKGSPFLHAWPAPTQDEARLWLAYLDSLADAGTFGHGAFGAAGREACSVAWTFHLAGAPWAWVKPIVDRFVRPRPADLTAWGWAGPSHDWLHFLRNAAPREDAVEAFRAWVDAAIVHHQEDPEADHRISNLVEAYLALSSALAPHAPDEAVRMAEEAVVAAEALVDPARRGHGLVEGAREFCLERAARQLAALRDGP